MQIPRDVTSVLETVRGRLGLDALPPMPTQYDELPWKRDMWLPDAKPLGILRTIAFVWRMRKTRPPT